VVGVGLAGTDWTHGTEDNMNETLLTVVGNVATEPVLRTTSHGARVTSFRLASTERRFDRGTGQWRDGPTTFYTVTSWRATAENVATSVHKGQPLLVHGRFRESSYDDKEGVRRQSLEVEAYAVGHDLSKGTTTFSKSAWSPATPAATVVEQDEDAAMPGSTDVTLERVDPVPGELVSGDDGFRAPFADEPVGAAAG
jgi:single-strand DNA-binding protein